METLLPALAQYGLAGVLVGVIVVLHLYNVRVLIPRMMDESRAQHREDLAAYREESAAARTQHDRHITALVERLDAIEHVLSASGLPPPRRGHQQGIQQGKKPPFQGEIP